MFQTFLRNVFNSLLLSLLGKNFDFSFYYEVVCIFFMIEFINQSKFSFKFFEVSFKFS